MVVINSLFVQPPKLHPLVLIVESDEDTRQMMKYLLQMWKYSVIETADAAESLKLIEAEKPDFILFSSRLQRDEDFTVIRRMRDLLPNEKTGIIYISAYSEPTVRASAFAAGADNYLVKPIDFGILEKMLQSHFKTESKRREMFL